MAKKKVLLLAQYIGTGGLEYMKLNLALSLKAQGEYEPFIFAYQNSLTQNDLLQIYEREGISVFCVPKKMGFSFRTVIRIIKVCITHRIRLIHSHDIGPLIYAGMARLCSFGVIKHVHTQHSFHHIQEFTKYSLYEKIFSRVANQVCVVSEYLRDVYSTIGIAKDKITYIPNGISIPEKVPHTWSDKQKAQEKICLENASLAPILAKKKFWLLSLARISKTKGQPQILSLWNRLTPQQKENWALLFVGPEQEKGFIASLQNSLHQNDSVVFAGPTKLPASWYAASTLYCSASVSEGLPLAPVEALASNLPVLLSEIPGHEFLRSFGAEFFPLNEEEDAKNILFAEMKKCASAQALPQTNAAIAHEFDLERMCRAYRAVYNAVLY